MFSHELCEPAGRVTIIARDRDGNECWRRHHKNLITTAGRTLLAQMVTGTAVIHHLDLLIGSGATSPAAGNSTLEQPFAEDGTAEAEVKEPEATQNDEGLPRMGTMVIATFPARTSGEVQSIFEAGIQITLDNNNSSTVLYNRVTFPVISRTLNLSLTFQWELVF